MWIARAPNAAILLVNEAVHPKVCLVAEDDFFTKMGISFQLQDFNNFYALLNRVALHGKMVAMTEYNRIGMTALSLETSK